MIESITPHTRYTPHTEYWVTWTQHKTWPQTQRLLPPSLPDTSRFLCLWVGFIFMPFCLSWQTGGSGLHPQHHCDHASSHQQQHHLISETTQTQSASLWSLHHLICITVIMIIASSASSASLHLLISDTTQSASLWSLYHLICIIVIIHHLISIIVISSSSHHFYCDHFIISIFVIIASSHQHHCDHALPASLFAGSMAMVTACVMATVMTNDGGLAMLWRWSLSLSSDGVSGETGTRQTVSRRISSHRGYPY